MKKKIIILSVVAAVGAIIAYRAVQISRENSRPIFNAARSMEITGMPVETVIAETGSGTLREPVAVKKGRAFVSGARMGRFKAGQRLTHADESGGGAAGAIVSVSRKIDLDTGLFAIKTSGRDGNFFAEVEYAGVFLPLNAVKAKYNFVMVSENGIASARKVRVIASDSDRAVVTGLSDGDVVILTKVEAGVKVKPIANN